MRKEVRYSWSDDGVDKDTRNFVHGLIRFESVKGLRRERNMLCGVASFCVFLYIILVIIQLATATEAQGNVAEIENNNDGDAGFSALRFLSLNSLIRVCGAADQENNEANSEGELFYTCFQNQPVSCKIGNTITLNGCPVVNTTCGCEVGQLLSAKQQLLPEEICQASNECIVEPLEKLSFISINNSTESNVMNDIGEGMTLCQEGSTDFQFCSDLNDGTVFTCKDNEFDFISCGGKRCGCEAGLIVKSSNVCLTERDDAEVGNFSICEPDPLFL